MKMKRTWRVATAGLAAAALMGTAVGGAAAQSPEDLLDPSQLEELTDLLGGDDEGGDGDGPTGTPLDALLEILDPSQLEELADLLGGDDEGGDGDGPTGTPLDALLEVLDPSQLEELLDLLGGDLPGLPGDDDDAADDDGEPTEGPAVGGPAGDAPETDLGGFAGTAEAQGLTVFVGLPGALADGLEPVLDALGVAGSMEVNGATRQGIRIDLAQVQADLERAAEGEEISSESRAFITNLLLASGAADEPGNCTGAPQSVELPPDAETPLIDLTIAGVDCEETDERALADVEILGLDIRLAALLELGLPDEVADGVDTLIEQLNEALLAPVSEGLCTALDPLLDALLGAEPCEDDNPLLQLRNPFDLDVPVVDVDVIGATAEVTRDDEEITATGTSRFASANVLGVVCVGNEGGQPFQATATSDGSDATADGSAPSVEAGLCQQEQSLLRILLGEGPLGDIALFERIVQDDLLDGALQPVFDGVDELLDTLNTTAITQASLDTNVDGSGATAVVNPFVVASTLPLDGLPGLGDVLGDLSVVLVGGEARAGVNAVPAGITPEAPPEEPEEGDPVTPAGDDPLPRTGAAGAGALLGLAALGAAAGLRRRED